MQSKDSELLAACSSHFRPTMVVCSWVQLMTWLCSSAAVSCRPPLYPWTCNSNQIHLHSNLNNKSVHLVLPTGIFCTSVQALVTFVSSYFVQIYLICILSYLIMCCIGIGSSLCIIVCSRNMTNVQRNLLAQFMNNLNNSMNQQNKRLPTTATSNTLFPRLVGNEYIALFSLFAVTTALLHKIVNCFTPGLALVLQYVKQPISVQLGWKFSR